MIALQALTRQPVFEAPLFALSDVDELANLFVSAGLRTAAIFAETATVRFRDPAVSRERPQACSQRLRMWRSTPGR